LHRFNLSHEAFSNQCGVCKRVPLRGTEIAARFTLQSRPASIAPMSYAIAGRGCDLPAGGEGGTEGPFNEQSD
jgi:hypothetical protein